MDLTRTSTGRWKLRWREAGRYRARTFDRKGDAEDFDSWRRRQRQLGAAAVPEDVTLAEFVEVYWRLHAVPNLAAHTRDDYKRVWANHVRPRLGDYGVRELSAKRLRRFRDDLERARVGEPTIQKAFTVVQSMLTFAMGEGLVDHNAGRAVKKPAAERQREPHIFQPAAVERIRSKLTGPLDRTLVALLAYSGPRPEEALRLTWRSVGTEAIRYDGRKTRRPRHTPLLAPLAEDLREWFLASGRPGSSVPVFPAHDGGLWQPDDWRNWRRRIWKGEPERPRNDRRSNVKPREGAAPAGTRPRDLRSSYVTVQVYAGVPLTTVAREVGTSVAMLERHYAGVIANWNGVRVDAVAQIRSARDRQIGLAV